MTDPQAIVGKNALVQFFMALKVQFDQLTVFPLTCLGSFVLQGSILTFDPAVKAEIARQRSCCRISGSINSHLCKTQKMYDCYHLKEECEIDRWFLNCGGGPHRYRVVPLQECCGDHVKNMELNLNEVFNNALLLNW